MATSKARRAWDDLNQRQQTYLRILYDADQALEEEHHDQGARGQWSSAPARVWRRIDVNSYYSSVAGRLRTQGVYDSGLGSTLSALTDRALIQTGDDRGSVCAWMTRAGRAAVRSGLGIGPAADRPAWAMSEWMWRALVMVAETGTEGLPTSELWNAAHRYLVVDELMQGNRGYLDVTITYVQYKVRDHNGALYDPPHYGTRDDRHYHLTDAGRAHYVEHVAVYRELYPDIDAPDLPTNTPMPTEASG
ncbi:hypothetical protein OG896_24505 [Streptomyces sp. NBC_00669]|uniref:hypothetical protein n=1 Tax=Streptomyces sp. NBC_00669 TaxID=2976011 RepID=UPI002E36802D|nr:hypothetical protein [Streptomyces sp. NBC_00669]